MAKVQAYVPPVEATITRVGELEENDYGQYRNITFQGTGLTKTDHEWHGVRRNGYLKRFIPFPDCEDLAQGARVMLTPTTKPKNPSKPDWGIQVIDQPAQAQAAPHPGPATQPRTATAPQVVDERDLKTQIGDSMQQLSKLRVACHRQVTADFWELARRDCLEEGGCTGSEPTTEEINEFMADPDTIRAAGSSVYVSLVRKFRLES